METVTPTLDRTDTDDEVTHDDGTNVEAGAQEVLDNFSDETLQALANDPSVPEAIRNAALNVIASRASGIRAAPAFNSAI